MYKARTSNAIDIDKVRNERGSESDSKGVRISSNDDVTPQYSVIKCSSLLCCVRKSCDADVFSAMNESGLVYDGGAVVDQVNINPLVHHVPVLFIICHLSLPHTCSAEWSCSFSEPIMLRPALPLPKENLIDPLFL